SDRPNRSRIRCKLVISRDFGRKVDARYLSCAGQSRAPRGRDSPIIGAEPRAKAEPVAKTGLTTTMKCPLFARKPRPVPVISVVITGIPDPTRGVRRPK